MRLIANIFKEEPSDNVQHMSLSVFWRIAIIGAGAGIAGWLLAMALDRLMLTPIFCSGVDVNICTDSQIISSNVASILIGIIVVPILLVTGIKRPLLVVAAATIALWGVTAWNANPWLVALPLVAISYALAYLAITWINRVRSNLIAIIAIVVLVVLARVVLSF